MSWRSFFSITSLLFFLLAIFSYYIFVNTIYSKTILPNITVKGKDVSGKTEEEYKYLLLSSLKQKAPPLVHFKIDEFEFQIPTDKFALRIITLDPVNYGKGADFTKVITEGVSLFKGKDFLEYDWDLDVDAFVNAFPIHAGSDENFAAFYGSSLTGCSTKKYKFTFNRAYLKSLIKSALINDGKVVSTISAVNEDKDVEDIIKYCKEYEARLAELNLSIRTDWDLAKWESILDYVFEYGKKPYWKVKDPDPIKVSLGGMENSYFKEMSEGEYKLDGNKMYIFRESARGQSMNLDKSFENLASWLKNDSTKFEIALNYDIPEAEGIQAERFDFTQVYAEGKTRLDIIRNGKPNAGLPNAVNGLKWVDGYIIQPGAEFSFIKAARIWKDNHTPRGGICNSTTTLYRAGLEAGFPFTERHSHPFFVASYDWGPYEINSVVDASYASYPRADLRFINDLAYPVYVKVEITRDGSNFQYHTVKLLTSKNAEKRKVEFVDWKKWNVRTSTAFRASYTRKVWQGEQLIRTDTFSNRFFR